MVTDTFGQIHEALDLDPDRVADAAERVERRKDRVDNWGPVTTTRELPSGDRVHLHQLVTDGDDRDYVVVEFTDEAIKLSEISLDDNVQSFDGTVSVSYGEFMMGYEAEKRNLDEWDGTKPSTVPVWGY